MGGDDRKIVVYSRETSSELTNFQGKRAEKQELYGRHLSMPQWVLSSIRQSDEGVTRPGWHTYPRTKTLSVSYDGSHYAAPDVGERNEQNATYPIVRPLYYYYNVKNKEQGSL